MNARLSHDKSHVYFLYRGLRIAKIDLENPSYTPKQFFGFSELQEVMKFGVEMLDNEVVALGINGLLKFNKGHQIHNLSSKSKRH